MTQDEILKLSIKEKKQLQEELLEQLKWLNLSQRSDWHAGFEAFLKVDVHEAEGGIKPCHRY